MAALKPYSAGEWESLLQKLTEEDEDLQGLLAIFESGRLSKTQREDVRQLLKTVRAKRDGGRKRDPEVEALAIEAMRLRLKGTPRKTAPCEVTSDGNMQKRVARMMDEHPEAIRRLAKRKITTGIER